MIVDGYFDASGKHKGSSALIVAGFLARPDEWAAFEVEWTGTLAEWELPAFHMSDFAGRRGPFEGWSEAVRRERLAAALAMINRHVLGSVGIVMPYERYNKHVSGYPSALSGGPYTVAGIALFREVADLITPMIPDAEVAYVYEEGDQGAGQFQKLFQDNYGDPEQRAKYHLLSLRFESKMRFVQLQAADILAYEMYRDIPRYFGTSAAKRRYPLQVLGAKPNSWVVMSEENMKAFGEVINLGVDHSEGSWNKSKVSLRPRPRSRRRSKRGR